MNDHSNEVQSIKRPHPGHGRVARFGVHGDPLPDGKLDLPELRCEPTAEEWAWARFVITALTWREAVTYRETAPHEYTVKAWLSDPEAFDRFVELIRRCGFGDFYYRARHIYWVVDSFKYWTMGWPVAETTVINRAPLDAPEPWREP